jgi:hypothetical protein
MNNKEFLQKRLVEYETKAKQASEQGDYPQFQKWDLESNNIKKLIKMNEAHTDV